MFTRPIGGYIFGMIAQKKGPLIGLSYSLIGVSICTLLIGFMPSYSTIGWVGAALVVLLRFINGIFAAGEVTISRLYILKNKDIRLTYKISSYYEVSTIVGIVLASAFSAIVLYTTDEIQSVLWRICFILGGCTGIFGYMLRIQGVKTCTGIVYYNYTSMKTIILQNKYELFVIALNIGIGHITYAVPFILMNTLIPIINPSISVATMMSYNTLLLIFDGVLLLLYSKISINFAASTIIIFSCACLSIIAAFMFTIMMYFNSLVVVTAMRLIIALCGTIIVMVQNVYYKDLLKDTCDKYVIMGVSNALGSSIGKITPVLCLWMFHTTGSIFPIGVYITIFTTLNIFAVVSTIKCAD